ncbi:MAG TPA: hypothetical protein VK614_03720 [Allosphingosinicella sp.]|nr:hypothetical protein [Allosphingosinicella sp.]
MASSEKTFNSADLADLKKLALRTIHILAAALVVSFVAGGALLVNPGGGLFGNPAIDQFAAVVLIGIAGSATAALTSCLNRYANGYEDEDGNKLPPEGAEATKDRFNERIAVWLRMRPLLGGVVAPIFIWGLAQFPNAPDGFRAASADHATTLGFTAFMAGLLAKSVLELIKNLFKNVFRA